jgi:hypothetical protein
MKAKRQLLELELKILGLTAIVILSSFVTVLPRQVPATAQVDADTVCLTNPAMCSYARTLERQQEWSERMEEARNEVLEEQAEEAGNPTIDEFMQEVDEEGEFDDEREREEMQENGFEIDEETGDPIALSADVRPKGYDTEFGIEFLNQTFGKILHIEPTEIDTESVLLDTDDEEGTTRQIIFYEFNPDTEADDVRIYTTEGQTVQALATHIATYINSTDITLYDNGRAVILCEGAESFDEVDDTTIYAPHNYTAANGYRYTNGTIVSPAGQELLSTAYGMHGIDDYMAEAEIQQQC